MIVCISTSSPWASVALLDEDGSVKFSHKERSDRNASGTVCRLLRDAFRQTNQNLQNASGFVADSGPGSFTGVKVGVTLAKALAFAVTSKVALISSFDLIARDRPVAVPNKKGEWHLRIPGSNPIISTRPAVEGLIGYGLDLPIDCYPEAQHAEWFLRDLVWMQPELAVPTYGAEPSISIPKSRPNHGVQRG